MLGTAKAKDLYQWNGTSDVATRSKVANNTENAIVSPYADALRAGSSARETSNATREIAREPKKPKKNNIPGLSGHRAPNLGVPRICFFCFFFVFLIFCCFLCF